MVAGAWLDAPTAAVVLYRSGAVAMGVVTLPCELDIGLVWTHLYGGDPFDA